MEEEITFISRIFKIGKDTLAVTLKKDLRDLYPEIQEGCFIECKITKVRGNKNNENKEIVERIVKKEIINNDKEEIMGEKVEDDKKETKKGFFKFK